MTVLMIEFLQPYLGQFAYFHFLRPWWLLALICIVTAAGLARWLQKRHSRRAFRRAGQAELQQLFADWQVSGDTRHFLQQLNEVLKRAALHSFPGTEVASLSGERWTTFLDQCTSAAVPSKFGGGPLESAAYSEQFEGVDVESLQRSSLLWLQQHRSKPA